ncbi:hypothetical protein [Coleofasciculus sp. FACHB-T130]|uniref:hypothetical protein n=1 Tax=Cyanophyceae TaxID=3028117 RepID=UPI001685587F|nr:hypothetical protein [Coleofasciculus sp. FACHB-T130]MBD1879079.1 hypothetical protein [Coleofasciculus sp. FACHB-T130]
MPGLVSGWYEREQERGRLNAEKAAKMEAYKKSQEVSPTQSGAELGSLAAALYGAAIAGPAGFIAGALLGGFYGAVGGNIFEEGPD